ncbi:O-antigen ligase family protein [Enterococcus sp. BWT-B8]|uniref:O-antigen ligase family protein n=1 Tax=Enterococcus sp. BWT-B8 TaxID=2885157 RepID=UPI001E4DD462|nr:O-antigen ligase family protein [Enterococcus sp. BWT-B8]MCB5951539.1 O-antigen ligase family protein [Enterococcus sp. BWT-B8]
MLQVLFLLMSLGTMVLIPLGGSYYQVKYLEIGLLCFFILILLKVLLIKKKPFQLGKASLVYLFLFFVMSFYSLITNTWSTYGRTSLVGVSFFLYGLIVAAMSCFYQFKLHDYIRANRILLLSLTVQLCISFYDNGIFSNNLTGYYNVKYVSSTLLGNSNYISMFVVFIMIFEIIARVKFWPLFTIISGVALIFSMSKGAIISLVIVLAIYIFLETFGNKYKMKFKNIFVILFLIGIFLIVLYSTTLGMKTIEMIRYSLETGSSSGRDALYSYAFEIIKNNPWGIGYTDIDNPHNFIVESMRSYGILFGLIATFIFIYPLRMLRQMLNSSQDPIKVAFYLAYISLLIHSLVEIFFYTTLGMIWTIITIFVIEEVFRNEYHDNIEL